MVSFYDAFADAKHGCLNLVVDYMDGGSLQDIVDRGGCPNEDVIACISYQVLMGLHFLHQRKKIHRDIKPSNLLINSMGYVRIADFGVSRSMDVNDQVDTFIGTLGYMSPERITGQEYSYEADIWGFGLSIVACTLGAFPLNTLVGGGGYWGLVHAGMSSVMIHEYVIISCITDDEWFCLSWCCVVFQYVITLPLSCLRVPQTASVILSADVL